MRQFKIIFEQLLTSTAVKHFPREINVNSVHSLNMSKLLSALSLSQVKLHDELSSPVGRRRVASASTRFEREPLAFLALIKFYHYIFLS